jgi:hypothetical protein
VRCAVSMLYQSKVNGYRVKLRVLVVSMSLWHCGRTTCLNGVVVNINATSGLLVIYLSYLVP